MERARGRKSGRVAWIYIPFQLQIPILYGDNKKTHGPTNIKLKVSRRASRGWGLRSCPRCGRAVRPRRAVPRCCAECSKRGPGGGSVANRRFGGASARPRQGCTAGLIYKQSQLCSSLEGQAIGAPQATGDRLYRRQDGAFGHAATSEVPVEQRVRIGRGEVESAAALEDA